MPLERLREDWRLDDVELVELMQKVLEEDGRFEVRVATTGFDAGMMVKEYHPDIIVLDVMLPDINGKEVCRILREDDRGPPGAMLEKPDAGTLRIGETVQIGYVDQSRDALAPNKSVWEEITGGEIKIGDRLVNDVAPKDRDIAMVFQNYALFPHMTVAGNIAFPRQITANTIAWTGENPASGNANSAFTFDQVSLSPKTVMASTAYSRQAAVQTTPEGYQLGGSLGNCTLPVDTVRRWLPDSVQADQPLLDDIARIGGGKVQVHIMDILEDSVVLTVNGEQREVARAPEAPPAMSTTVSFVLWSPSMSMRCFSGRSSIPRRPPSRYRNI